MEAKLIELWADVLDKYNGKIMAKKSKEKIVTQQLNDYCDQVVSLQPFSVSDVRNKIDSIVKKAKGIYAQYRLPKETGCETDDADIALDEEAAKLAWPNFAVFIAHFRNHPSLGPGSVDDASLLPNLPLPQRAEEDLFVTTGVVLLLVPRLLLQPISRGGKSGYKEVERRFQLFKEEKWGELFNLTKRSGCKREVVADSDLKTRISSNSESHLVSSVLNKIKFGALSRAANILTSSGIASDTDDTFQKLKQKHPSDRILSSNTKPSSPPTSQPIQYQKILLSCLYKDAQTVPVLETMDGDLSI